MVSLLQSSTKLDSKDVLTLVSDMLLAGVDTTSYTMSFLLYLLSKHPEVQSKLRSQIRNGKSHFIKMACFFKKANYNLRNKNLMHFCSPSNCFWKIG